VPVDELAQLERRQVNEVVPAVGAERRPHPLRVAAPAQLVVEAVDVQRVRVGDPLAGQRGVLVDQRLGADHLALQVVAFAAGHGTFSPRGPSLSPPNQDLTNACAATIWLTMALSS